MFDLLFIVRDGQGFIIDDVGFFTYKAVHGNQIDGLISHLPRRNGLYRFSPPGTYALSIKGPIGGPNGSPLFEFFVEGQPVDIVKDTHFRYVGDVPSFESIQGRFDGQPCEAIIHTNIDEIRRVDHEGRDLDTLLGDEEGAFRQEFLYATRQQGVPIGLLRWVGTVAEENNCVELRGTFTPIDHPELLQLYAKSKLTVETAQQVTST